MLRHSYPPRPIVYIDDVETLLKYKRWLLEKINNSDKPIEQLLRRHEIMLPANYEPTKKDTLAYINKVCDALTSRMRQFNAYQDKAVYISDYLKRYYMDGADERLRTLYSVINCSFEMKSKLFNFPVEPVTFAKLVRLNEQHEVMLSTLDHVLKLNAGSLELTILFSMEGDTDHKELSNLRNTIRHGLLTYTAYHGSATNQNTIRKILSGLPKCATATSIHNFLAIELSYAKKSGLFRDNPLREALMAAIVANNTSTATNEHNYRS